MNLIRLIHRNLAFYRRTGLGVLLAAALGAAVLTGALFVGDSVRYSLARRAELRLGRIQYALIGGDRFVRRQLADDLSARIASPVAPAIILSAAVVNPDTDQRVNQVQVIGIDDRFFALGPPSAHPLGLSADQSIAGAALARRLNIKPGADLVVRAAKPGLLPRDVALSGDEDASIAFRIPVAKIADDDRFGGFNLFANQTPPMNLFVPLNLLAETIERPDSVNVLLIAAGFPADQLRTALNQSVRPEDLGLDLRTLPSQSIELRSRRVFLEPALSAAALKTGRDPAAVFTYFVNDIRLGDRATPYSIVSAVAPVAPFADVLPADFPADGIVVNQWLADDLSANVGDSITLRYFLVDESRRLVETESQFKIAKIIPIDNPAITRDLMPDFPGLADVENCREWKPGIPIQLDRIREKDEKYWDDFRGTPKAILPLSVGQKIWQNRFGDLTAVRWPAVDNTPEQIAAEILSSVDPADAGLTIQPIRRMADRAKSGSSDFAGLFLGLSFFLIASAIILIALIFSLGLQQRFAEAGILLSIGWPAKKVRRVFLAEAAVLAIGGALLGVIAALGYTFLMIRALETIWSGAVAGSSLWFHATLRSLFLGSGISSMVSLASIVLTLRKPLRRPARELLAGSFEIVSSGSRPGRIAAWIGGGCAIVGILSLIVGLANPNPGLFFATGSLLLIAALALANRWLAWTHDKHVFLSRLSQLARRNATRRKIRSLAVMILLAVGVFLVVAVGANRKNPLASARQRSSGTGGFALFAQSTIDLTRNPATAEGIAFYNLDAAAMKDVAIVPMRVREGDDASCLNLNRAQQPRICGVDPKRFKDLVKEEHPGPFRFKKQGASWFALEQNLPGNSIPAVGDYATVYWALGKRMGDEMELTDDNGKIFRLRIVGMLQNSILQGGLIISETDFIRRFPSIGGYKTFLIDAPTDRQAIVSDAMARGLRDYGLEIQPAADRLAMFAAVENTYLSIFALLGGMGLIVGTIGLAFVLRVNVLQRAGELAMMRAVGFSRSRLHALLIREHFLLVILGVVIGAVCGFVAVLPAVMTAGNQIPAGMLIALIVAIAVCGLLCVRAAASAALRGDLIDALRNE